MDLTHFFLFHALLLEKGKVERGQDTYSLDLHDGNFAKCKTPSSISAADMYCYCSQRLRDGGAGKRGPLAKINRIKPKQLFINEK